MCSTHFYFYSVMHACMHCKCNIGIRGDLCVGSLFFKDSHIVVAAML